MSKRTRSQIQAEMDRLKDEIDEIKGKISDLAESFDNAPYAGKDVVGDVVGYGIKVDCPKLGLVEIPQYKQGDSDVLSEGDMVFDCECGGKVWVQDNLWFTHEDKE